jgi:hypothetical protein
MEVIRSTPLGRGLNFVAKMPQITRKMHGMREFLSNTPILSPRGYSQLSPFHLSRLIGSVFSHLQGAMP